MTNTLFENIELVGKHTKVIPMTKEHTEDLYLAGKDQRIWSYMPMTVYSSVDMAELVDTALEDKHSGKAFPFVILNRDNNQIIGSTRFLDISIRNKKLEIGWTWLSPTVWRTTINTEVKYLLLNHCFETLGTIRVQLKTDERNVRSQKAIERIGAVKEGTLRNHRIMPDGFYRHSVYFSIIDSEWPTVKKNLTLLLEN